MLRKGKEEELKNQQAKTDEENMEDSAQKHEKITLLARLEELIKSEEVWKFGFGYVSMWILGKLNWYIWDWMVFF